MWPMQTMQIPSMSDYSSLPDPAPGHSLVFFLSSEEELQEEEEENIIPPDPPTPMWQK